MGVRQEDCHGPQGPLFQALMINPTWCFIHNPTSTIHAFSLSSQVDTPCESMIPSRGISLSILRHAAEGIPTLSAG